MLKENLSSEFPNRSDINWAVQPKKMARGLKYFEYQEYTDCTIYLAKTKEPLFLHMQKVGFHIMWLNLYQKLKILMRLTC